MSQKKYRVLHVVMQPVLVVDDGEQLTQGPLIAPMAVPLSELASLADRIVQEVAALPLPADSE